MISVPIDQNVPTSFFNVVVKFATAPKKKTTTVVPKTQNSTNSISSKTPATNNTTQEIVTNSTNHTSSSSSQNDFSQMNYTTDDDGNLLICVSLTNSKYSCQPDEAGEMLCGTDLKVTKSSTELISNQPTMVISEINKYGVFYLTFS
jgi:hypothetical protein